MLFDILLVVFSGFCCLLNQTGTFFGMARLEQEPSFANLLKLLSGRVFTDPLGVVCLSWELFVTSGGSSA